jgi:tetratricopeptide (TPR) repeat protein
VRGDEAVRLSELTDFPFSLALALEGLAYLHLRRGEIPEAIVLLERGLQICEQWQLHLSHYVIQAYLGYAYALDWRDSQAMPLLAESVTIDGGFHPALRVTMQGEAHLLAGRRDLAQQCVDRALALGAVGEERGSRAWTLRPAAEVELTQGLENVDRAAEHYQAALSLATDLEMRLLEAHCHLGLGKLYRRMDRVQDAHVELSAAVTMLTEMEMALWLPEARAELAEAR